VPVDAAWLSYWLICLARMSVMSEGRLLKLIHRAARSTRSGLLMPYFGDIEFFGYGGNAIREPIPVERLAAVLRAIAKDPSLRLVLPGDAAMSDPSLARQEPVYVKSGTWSSQRDFALWRSEPDNEVLDGVCERAFELYRAREARLDPELRAKVLRTLLLAWNSDGRGWTPIPEHRLFCFDRALEAQRLLEKA
jgi:hypothetical protein